ncbi:MAG: glycosyltransferase family 4 protein [Candidatus Verstraetearchaeota archaeon]|nr:glycosyltransferase family 4 protein [Candidatus Verstraetearchaeota archaeon]
MGGISSHISTLSRELRKRKNNVYVISLSSFPIPIRIVLMSLQYSFDFIRKGLGSFLRQIVLKLLMNIYIFFYCLAKDIEIINAHDCVSLNSTWLAKKTLKIPTVLTVHGYLTLERIAHGNLDEKIHTLVKLSIEEEKRAYKNADYIVTVDSRLKIYISKFNVNKCKIIKIENFVDPEEFHVNLDRMTCRQMFNIPPEKIVILVPRRLVKKNGVLLPLYALQYVPENVKNTLLLIYCGTGPLEETIKTYVQKNALGNVILMGAISHEKMKFIYKASDIVLIPSIPVKGVEEATSISALEAMAIGVPLIASNVGGLKEIIINDVNGILVQPKPSLIAKAIIDVLSGAKSIDKCRMQQFVKESFVRNIEKIIYVYNNALKERKQ